MSGETILRAASPADAAALLEIYAPYVLETAISFEYAVPSLEEFRSRIAATLEKYPYIVVERDCEILGYAYAGAFARRAAYAWNAEVSIYLRRDCHGCGLGKRLYGALEALCRAQGILSLQACIATTQAPDEHLTNNSRGFHAHLGYATSGAFRQCGYKFGRWYDMIWMEKHIAAHVANPLPPIPFPALGADVLRACGLQV